MQEQIDNGDLTARLDDARNLLRDRGLDPDVRLGSRRGGEGMGTSAAEGADAERRRFGVRAIAAAAKNSVCRRSPARSTRFLRSEQSDDRRPRSGATPKPGQSGRGARRRPGSSLVLYAARCGGSPSPMAPDESTIQIR